MYLFFPTFYATHPSEVSDIEKADAKKSFLPVGKIFVFLHLLSRAKAVSKKSIAIKSLLSNFAKVQVGGRSNYAFA